MITIENTETYGFEAAIRGMRAKGFRKRKGKFETFVSVKGISKSLGTYSTEDEAAEAVHRFRIKRFIDNVHSDGLHETNCAVTNENYVVFTTGEIYNLHGVKIVGKIDKNGYREVTLNGKQCTVHRIVAEAFIPNPECKKCVNHIDGNKLNNSADNLEWVTHSENIKHAYNTGLERKICGENHHAHKLTESDVKYIRKMYKKRDKRFGAVPLSKKFGVDRTTIFDIVNLKTWREVYDCN